jgi:hypothetical protein
LIPIRLDDCEPSYEELRKLHRVDFMPNWNEGKRRLLSTLKKLLVETDDSILTELLTHLLVRRNERRFHSREEFLKASKSSTDFSGYNLMHLDLSRLDLSGFSFVGANLVGTKLASSKLNGVNFRWANLERANLNYSDLGQSWIAYVNLWGTTMKRARNIRSAVIENNNIFNLKGLSDNQQARFKRTGGFETGSYDGFFSYFIKSLKLTPKRIVGDCRWLGHRYFRTLFSNEARLVLGHLSSFYHELAHVSYGPPERVILLDEPDVFYSGLLINDMPFPIVEVVDNSFTSSYKKRKKIKK